MINAQAFSFQKSSPGAENRSFTLLKSIAAIQVLPGERGGETKLGMITQLPRDAELRVCGDGFNERTVRVRWAEGFYFVFLQDLELPRVVSAGR